MDASSSVSLWRHRCAHVESASLDSITSSAPSRSVLGGSVKSNSSSIEITREVAHRIRQFTIIRVRDRQKVLVESLWHPLTGVMSATIPSDASESGATTLLSSVSSGDGRPPPPPATAVPQQQQETDHGSSSSGVVPPPQSSSSSVVERSGCCATVASSSLSSGNSCNHTNNACQSSSYLSGVKTPSSLSVAPMLVVNDHLLNVDEPIRATATGRPVLISLFRRWGCCICRMTAASLSALKPFLDDKGVDLVGIGYEEVGLDKFIAARRFAGELFLDPEKQVYRAVECKIASAASMYGCVYPDVFRAWMMARERNFENNFEGDFSQYGAVMLIDQNGLTRFLQVQTKQKFLIDTVKILEILGVNPGEHFEAYPSAKTSVW